MVTSLVDVSVVVIGGSSGIGLATASLASAAGARVTIAGRDEDRLKTAVRPGIVDTPLLDRLAPGRRDDVLAAMAKRVPAGRVAQPEEIADAIVFLMGNEYVTGSVLTIDGGSSLV